MECIAGRKDVYKSICGDDSVSIVYIMLLTGTIRLQEARPSNVADRVDIVAISAANLTYGRTPQLPCHMALTLRMPPQDSDLGRACLR
jgi:hypothetical protein